MLLIFLFKIVIVNIAERLVATETPNIPIYLDNTILSSALINTPTIFFLLFELFPSSSAIDASVIIW